MTTRIRLVNGLAALLTLVMALVIFGCGGGGGGGNGTSGGCTTCTSDTDVQPIAFYAGTVDPASPFVVTPYNFQLVPGDKVQIQVWGINPVTQQLELIASSNYSIDAPSSVATISNSGLLTAISASPGEQYHIHAVANGTVYTSDFQVLPSMAKVTGLVRDVNGNPVGGVTVNFFSSSGTVLAAQTVTGSDGTFIANVPSNATSYDVDSSLVTNASNQPAYFKEYSAGNFYYSPDGTTCFSPLPALTTGQTTALLYPVVLTPSNNGTPPPPPTGCGQ